MERSIPLVPVSNERSSLPQHDGPTPHLPPIQALVDGGPSGPHGHDHISGHQESHLRSSMDHYRPSSYHHPPSFQPRPQGVGDLQRQMADLNARSRPASPGGGGLASGSTPPGRPIFPYDYKRPEYTDHYHSVPSSYARRPPPPPPPPQGPSQAVHFEHRPYVDHEPYPGYGPRYISPPDSYSQPYVAGRPIAYGKSAYGPHHISPLTSSVGQAVRPGSSHPIPAMSRTGIVRGSMSAPGSSFASPVMSEEEDEDDVSDEEYPHPTRTGRGHGHGQDSGRRKSGKRSRVGSPNRGLTSMPIKDEDESMPLHASAPTSPPKAVNRLLRRRTNHNVVERRRRDGINQLIYEICDLIPRDRFYGQGIHSPTEEGKDAKPPPNSVIVDGVARPNKAHVLRECVAYVKELHESIRILRLHAPPDVAGNIASPPPNDIVFFQTGSGGPVASREEEGGARNWRSEPHSSLTTPYNSTPASPSLGAHGSFHPTMSMTALTRPKSPKGQPPAGEVAPKTVTESADDTHDVAHLRQELESSLGNA